MCNERTCRGCCLNLYAGNMRMPRKVQWNNDTRTYIAEYDYSSPTTALGSRHVHAKQRKRPQNMRVPLIVHLLRKTLPGTR